MSASASQSPLSSRRTALADTPCEQFHHNTTTTAPPANTSSSSASSAAAAALCDSIVAVALCLPPPATHSLSQHHVFCLTASASTVSAAEDDLIPASISVSSSAAIATPSASPPPPARARPLLSSIQTNLDAMVATAVMDAVPDSPPELTTAASSQTSSFASSVRDEPGGENDVSHFEDIALEDVNLGLSLDSNIVAPTSVSGTTKSGGSPPLHLLPPPRRVITPISPPNGTPAVAAREIMASKTKNNYPTLRNQVQQAVHHRGRALPSPTLKRPPHRAFSSPSSTSSLHAPRKISRSTSPSTRPHRMQHTPPRAAVGVQPTVGQVSTGEAFAERRKSWQAGRKTVQELEDECHDSDDELPDDVVIWNIPLSPRPPQERSASQSPERLLVSPRHQSAPQIYIVAPEAKPSPPKPSPRTSVPANFPVSRLPDNHLSLEERNVRAARTRSWANAVSDLSIEARRLTAALEDYASNQDRLTALALQSRGRGTKSARSSTERPISTIIELPPIQKNNNLIDPLPISKEKAAVLSRTRPSWLPPKSRSEEERHLREYQAMMVAAQQAELRRMEKTVQEQRSRDEKQASFGRLWEEHVLPNWETAVKEPRSREMWWRGITPRARSKVWPRAIGNDLGLTTASYSAALERAKSVSKKLSTLSPDARAQARETKWFSDIATDVANTFPEQKIFQPSAPLHQPLIDLLMAYAVYRSDVGYVRGTHFPAALLLLNLTAAEAFVTLANLLNRPLPSHFLAGGPGSRDHAHRLVMQTLQYKRPQLHAHLTDSLEINPGLYVDSWFVQMFGGLGVDHASRIMDVYVFEGDKQLIRAAVGSMLAVEGKLYGDRADVLSVLQSPGRHVALREDEFMRMVREAGKVDK